MIRRSDSDSDDQALRRMWHPCILVCPPGAGSSSWHPSRPPCPGLAVAGGAPWQLGGPGSVPARLRWTRWRNAEALAAVGTVGDS